MPSKRVFLRTFGCQMNVRDSEFVMGLLLDEGFSKAETIEKADVIIYNSCSVRKHAEDRLISNIAELALEKRRKRSDLIIGLMGCTAQSYKEEILRRIPGIDFSVGPGNEAEIPAILRDIITHRCPVVAMDKVDKKRPELFPGYREAPLKAFVSIGEGCDNFCSYCIVPYVRGRERSREEKDILKEVRDLAARGYKEVTLLGQNVNSYRGAAGKNAFVKLLKDIDAIKGIRRVRFMTSHPKDASEELFRAMRDLESVCEHLHLPLQSGSDAILKKMNRKYTKAHYLKLVDLYKKYLPGGSITTDIIVGFPGETGKDFNDTVSVMKRVVFDSAFTFKYSPRPPAKSSELTDSVPAGVKEERLTRLIALQGEASLERNREAVGTVVDVLVEGPSAKDPSLLTGRTRTNKTAFLKGDLTMTGDIVPMKVETAKQYALIGRIA